MLFLFNFIISLNSCALGMKVFTFSEDSSDTSPMSSVTVTSASDNSFLPDHFLICSSHSQQQVKTRNTRTIYVLYEDSNFTKPWFSIGFKSNNKLWGNVRFKDWHELGIVTRETFLYWVHICVEVDTITGTLRASINGGNVTTVHNVPGLTPLPRLHLRLGVVHESYYFELTQFRGSVTNMNIFALKDRVDENLLSSASRNSRSSKLNEHLVYLNWTKAKLNVFGKGVKEEDFDEKDIYSESKVLNFKIPLLWNKIEATEECRKYGYASISKPTELTNMSNMDFENIYGKYFDQCEYFWTPFTDKYLEGTFVDELTNETIRYHIL